MPGWPGVATGTQPPKEAASDIHVGKLSSRHSSDICSSRGQTLSQGSGILPVVSFRQSTSSHPPMGIFSKRKDARKAVEAATATQEDPSTLQLDTGRPLPRFESSTSTVATGSPPPVIQKSCLKRASKSEGSICLTMYAANDRFARQSQTILITTAACDTPRPSLRSSSTSRMRKQVSFKLDDAHLPQSKPLFQARRPRREAHSLLQGQANSRKRYRRMTTVTRKTGTMHDPYLHSAQLRPVLRVSTLIR